MSDVPPPPPSNLTPPPGYIPYGGSDSVPYATRGIRGVARWLGILMMIIVPIQLLSVFGTISLANSAKDFVEGSISQKKFEDAYKGNIGQIGGFLVVPVAVLSIIWMFRMAKNIRALGRTDATFAPGWAIGGWFTPPCALYVVPWLMLRELWKGSDSESPADSNWKHGRVPAVLNAWWVLYGLLPLAGLLTSIGFLTKLENADTAELAKQLDKYATINIVLGVVNFGAAVAYLMVVRQLSARHMKAIGEI